MSRCAGSSAHLARAGALALALLAAGACAAPPYQANRELEDLLTAYRKQTALSAEREARRQAQGVRTLKVERRLDTDEWVVTADLERASLAAVVRRILDESAIPHLMRAASIPGQVTARIERLPLRRALGLLLEPQGLFVWERDAVLIIGEDPPAAPGATAEEALETPHPQPPPAPAAPSAQPPAAAAPGAAAAPAAPGEPAAAAAGPPVARAVQLRHLDVEAATKIFESLYPLDPQSNSRAVQLAPQPYTSTLVLSGAAAAVGRAARLLADLDRDPAHVMLEVLVVEFDTNELERLGTTLSGFQRGNVRGLSSAVGSAAGTALTFDYLSTAAGGAFPLLFRAAIDVLASQDKARVIARPYTAAMSGKKAQVKILRSRDIQQPFAAAPTASGTLSPPPPVTRETGVSLEVTPWVLADGRIRLELAVEESVFIDQLATNVISETDKNAASTTMMIQSGESIVIGGLAVQRKSSTNTGLPWLRHLPLINLATAQQSAAEQKQDVIIYITPYIVGPGVDTPFPKPDAFKFRDGGDDLTGIERLDRRPLWRIK